ncbi:hypothetical protein [Pararhodobacter marinus]|uniref:hypothetical protein n=1 Tax=Pararhodobacter marinus TaxID=2184063 RepID=UPI0035168F7B
MALTFPLALDDFFAGLPVAECEFHLPASLAMSRTRGGSIKTARLAERLWTGKVTLALQEPGDAAAVEAKVSALLEPGRTFFVHPLPFCYPQADPDGAGLAGALPVIHSVTPGGRAIRISGLPSGYVLRAGDMLSFAYGVNPTRYALHRIVREVTADIVGQTSALEVTPQIRADFVEGAPVKLKRPFTKALMLPPAAQRSVLEVVQGLTLEFIQTLG